MKVNYLSKTIFRLGLYLPILLATLPLLGQQIDKTYLIGPLVLNSTDEADPENFHSELIEAIIFDQINTTLEKKGFEKKANNKLLTVAATDQAEYMAMVENEDLIRLSNGEKATTVDRLEALGASRIGAELSAKTSINSGKVPYTYAKIADDIVFKWFSSSKKAVLLEGYQYNLMGISAKLDENKRKIYVSVVLGNYKTFNEGVRLISNLKVPYTTKTYGLVAENDIDCKKVNRNDNLLELQNGLTIEDNVIYFETNDLRSLQKLLDEKKDGLAVDILQREQFSCELPNILDHNLINQGILTKRIYTSKLFKKNIADLELNPKGFKTQLAVLPDGVDKNSELNLVIIKNKSVCQTIPQSFLIETSGTYTRKVKLLADTVTINSKFHYQPVTDSMELSFIVPFENKKYTYQSADIEPFLKLLNEPAFLIYEMRITAYSSIEGDDDENRTLQQQRAESILKALEYRQKEQIKTTIITDYNWNDFKVDIQNSKHNNLGLMQMTDAQNYIRTNELNKELEDILKNHRYAQIDLKVSYDITGANEAPFVLKQFHNAIAIDDKILALSIQKYIIKQVLNYRYNASIVSQMNIPNTKDFAGIQMNKIWLEYITKTISDNEFELSVEQLNKLAPENEYIEFNDIYLKINHPDSDMSEASLFQTRIDRLYYTPLKKETIDGLNIKLQFKLIAYADSTDAEIKVKEACINRIKKIVDLNDETMTNSLKLAALFIENNDFNYALKTLEPWIYNSAVTENLLFTYVSLCSRYDMRMHTERFNYAMKRCFEMNPTRYCDLFNGQYFSLRVFENQAIKESYCNFCNGVSKVVTE